MRQPFEGTADEFGKMSITPEELTRLVKTLDIEEPVCSFMPLEVRT